MEFLREVLGFGVEFRRVVCWLGRIFMGLDGLC